MSLPPELAPFADSLRQPAWERTASDTWTWLVERSPDEVLAERRLPVLVIVASIYARLCAPAGASDRAHAVVARFTLLFFLVDDAEQGDLPDLLAADASWSIGRYTPALRSWLGEFHEQATAPAPLRRRFAGAYHDYLAARRAEHGHHARPPSLEEHWAFRRRSIFMDPYLDLWMILLGIEPEALAEAEFAELRGLSVDLVLLANDLGSLARDRAGGDSPDDLNLVYAYARERNVSEAAALELLVEEHNRLVEHYRALTNRAVEQRPGPHAARYSELLTSVIEGNVASMRALGFRYPDAEPVLARLAKARG